MIDLREIDNIYLVAGPTDMRKGSDGLSAVVQYQLFMDPFSRNIFIFCGKRKRTIKILEWDKNGFWVYTKKLAGKDRFRWPKPNENGTVIINRRQLEWLLDGLDISQKNAHHTLTPVLEIPL